MLAAIAIPGQLATARLAGMPPAAGLYAFAAGSTAFAVLGANRYMSVAADSTIAPIFAGGLAAIAVTHPQDYPQMAALLALMVGAILVLVGLLRAGWLAALLSIPVTTGFLAGISVHIIVGELHILLGVADSSGHLIARLIDILARLGEANPFTLALGLGVLAVTMASARISSRIPGALIALVGAGTAVAVFNLGGHGVSLLGPLTVPLPHLVIPQAPAIPELSRMLELALVIAMVCIMQTAAVASTFPSEDGTPDNVSQNFLGVGAGNVVAGLVGAFAVDSSPPSTAIVKESGGRSQIASLTGVAIMVALAVFASGLTAFVPQAALSGVLIYIALRIFRVGEMVRIYRRGGREILLVAASAGLVIAFPIELGMLFAIVLSFLHSLFVIARPKSVELLRSPGSAVWWPPSAESSGERVAGVLVFAPSAPINFTNVEHICAALRLAISTRSQPAELVVIEANGVIDIDYTGSNILSALIAELRAEGTIVAMARLSDQRALAQARRTGLIAAIGEDRLYTSVDEALRRLRPTGAATSS
jgi:MFS superfamily sulfate permease-like transporter